MGTEQSSHPAFGMTPKKKEGFINSVTRNVFFGPENPDPRLEGLLRMVLASPSKVSVQADALIFSGATGTVEVRAGHANDIHVAYLPSNKLEPALLLYVGCEYRGVLQEREAVGTPIPSNGPFEQFP